MEVSKVGQSAPQAFTSWPGWTDPKKISIDIALAFVAAGFGLADLAIDWGGNGTTFSWTSALVIVAASGALLLRRRQPTTVLALVWIARPVVALDVNTEVALSIPAAIALYTFARATTRRNSIFAAVGASAVAALVILIVAPDKLFEELATEVLFALFVSTLAEAARTHEQRTAERVHNTTTARLQAERLRLAHDLHDSIAHSLSNIAVQSGVAARLIDTNPDHAKQALEIINHAGRSSLDELRSFLGLLRSDDEAIVAHRLPPAGPADIDQVIASAVRKGATIRTTRVGDFPEQTVETVAHVMARIVDESLTNVQRHAGPVATKVEIEHHRDRVELRIANEAGHRERPPVPSTGVGIIGMTERAEAIGGTLVAAPAVDGGFEVFASLPYEAPESSAS